jgi:hypothetical protein
MRFIAREQFAAEGRDHRIILDADADVPVAFGHAFTGPHVQAGLHRGHHAGLQDARGLLHHAPPQAVGLLDRRLVLLQVAAHVVHVAAQPVAGTVHVEGPVGSRADHLVEVAMAVAAEQAGVEQALAQHAQGRVVGIAQSRTGAHGLDGCGLRRQHDLVQLTLRGSEAAAHGKGAGDVARVAEVFAAGVDEAELPRLQRCVAGRVVQHAGIRPGGHDAGVGRAGGAMAAELVQQFSLQVVLAPGLAALTGPTCALFHGPHMRQGRDGAGAAHELQLVRVLHQAHLVQRGAQVVQPCGALHALALARPHGFQPALHLRAQPLVHAEGEPQRAMAADQLGHHAVEVLHAVGGIHAECRRGGLGAQPVAIPDLALGMARPAQQGASPAAAQHQPGLGLVEAGEVVEMAVGPVGVVGVAVARALGRRGQQGHAAAGGPQGLDQPRTALAGGLRVGGQGREQAHRHSLAVPMPLRHVGPRPMGAGAVIRIFRKTGR